ncbi:MAG: 2-octaprenyl-6-methoxyphenyl hydroxylase [Pseudomarimonas sp.]
MQTTHEILIVGGGLVGGSVACALAAAGRDVALIEATDPQTATPPSFDERNLALAAASVSALSTLGVLQHLRTPPSPVRRIHVSRVGDFGALRLDASEYGREALGGVVIARELGAALEARLAQLPTLTRYRPQRFVNLHADNDSIAVECVATSSASVSTSLRLSARLLLACDGSDSSVRVALGIQSDDHDYRQSLIVSALQADRPHAGQAWERFTASGPLAMLPRADGSYGCVCGVASEHVESLMALPDHAWLAELQQRFGGRAGRFLRVGKRSVYPITSRISHALVAPRALLLGNAAQTLHPIGAQGFNLGLRDALDVAELIADAADPGAPQVLQHYPARRQSDRQQTIAFSDGLARLTTSESLPHHVLRSFGLLVLANAPGLRAPMLSAAMGYRAKAVSSTSAVTA